ncbi:MAG TPA: SLC13/DASS family transporter [Planctomycetes bacterium]|nr:SLC13/DASS family transporter [Planctomycetota bacterium]
MSARVPASDPLSTPDGSLGVRRVGLVLGPALFLAILIAPGLSLDATQRRVAAITAWTATWWLTACVPVAAASLLPAALFPLFGVMGARDVAPKYMQDLVFLFLGAFVIALGLERWNVHRRIALAILARVGTRPRSLVLGFMIASAFLSFWINNTSTTLLMLPIGVAVVESVSGDESRARDPFAISLLLGMAYSSSVGGMATPVGTAPNQVFLGQLAERYPGAPDFSFGKWMLAWTPLVLLYLPMAWLLLTRVVLRVPDRGGQGVEVIRAERERLGPMGRAEKRMATVFCVTAFLWVTRADLDLGILRIPGWVHLVLPASIGAPSKFVTDATVAATMAVLCFLVPADRPGGPALMDWETAKKMPWEVLLLIGSGFAIAGAFQVSGLDTAFGKSLGPLLEGHSSWVVVGSVVILMAALTEITSNTATTVVLLPVFGQAAVAAGQSPLLFMAPATIAASAAFMLPVATPPNAVVFASRRIPAGVMARVGFFMNVLLAVLILCVFQFLGRRVLGIEDGLPDWARPVPEASAPQAPGTSQGGK